MTKMKASKGEGLHHETLLKKHYHENCPGCKVDQQKQMQRGLPLLQCLAIWVVVLCCALPISFLFPFLYFMVRHLHIAKREEDIAFYAGFIGASYMLGRSLTSTFWGMIADRYGRKPVIIIGTISVVIFNTIFGFSVNYWMAIASRFFLGASNGMLGAIRAYANEIFSEEYEALAMSSISASLGVGLIIGPALGGFLAQPADKYPGIFPSDSLFGRLPYLLPCLCISLFALAVTIFSFKLPETIHNHNLEHVLSHDLYESLESAPQEYNSVTETKQKQEPTSGRSLLKNWPLMSSIIAYCVSALQDMAYSEAKNWFIFTAVNENGVIAD